MKKLGMALTVLLLSTSAWAKGGGSGTYLGMNLDYRTNNAKSTTASTTTESKSSSMNYDLMLGYVMSSGLYVGAVYNGIGDTDAAGTDPKTTALGASVGYMPGNGFQLVAHYFLSAQQKSSAPDTTLTGTGMGVDIGYLFQVSGSFNLGAILAYRTVDYTKVEVSGTEVTGSKISGTSMGPKFVFAFMF